VLPRRLWAAVTRRGWWGKACLVEQAADHRGGGKLAGQLRGAGLLLAACLEVAAKVAVPLRASMVVEGRC
jgi:hypothetical protein